MATLTQDQLDKLEELKNLAENMQHPPMGAAPGVGPAGLNLNLDWLTQLLPILAVIFPQAAPWIPLLTKLIPIIEELLGIFNTPEGKAFLAAASN